MRKISTYFALIFTLSLLLTGCTTSNPNTNTDQSQTENDSRNQNDTGEEFTDDDVSADLIVKMDGFSFSPDLIEVEPGETIIVELDNLEGSHDFVIDELDVDSGLIDVGDSEFVEITVPSDTAVGTEYEFYCSVSDHRAMGMFGTLKVT